MTIANGNFDLPSTIREVANVLGRRRALELAGRLCPPSDPSLRGRTKRGRQGCLYVPKTLTQPLLELLGKEDGEKLVGAFPGEILWFGASRQLVLRHRNEAIRRRLAEGVRPAVVAAEFGLCERQIRNFRP